MEFTARTIEWDGSVPTRTPGEIADDKELERELVKHRAVGRHVKALVKTLGADGADVVEVVIKPRRIVVTELSKVDGRHQVTLNNEVHKTTRRVWFEWPDDNPSSRKDESDYEAFMRREKEIADVVFNRVPQRRRRLRAV